MTPGKYDLALYRGDSYEWRFQLWEDTGRTLPVDLTGSLVAAEFRDQPGGDVIVSMDCVISTAAGLSVPNVITVRLEPEMWPDAPPEGAWDLEVTQPDGDVQTIVAGIVKVTADVTHSTGMFGP